MFSNVIFLTNEWKSIIQPHPFPPDSYSECTLHDFQNFEIGSCLYYTASHLFFDRHRDVHITHEHSQTTQSLIIDEFAGSPGHENKHEVCLLCDLVTILFGNKKIERAWRCMTEKIGLLNHYHYASSHWMTEQQLLQCETKSKSYHFYSDFDSTNSQIGEKTYLFVRNLFYSVCAALSLKVI